MFTYAFDHQLGPSAFYLIQIHISQRPDKNSLCIPVIVLPDICQSQVYLIVDQVYSVIVDHIPVGIYNSMLFHFFYNSGRAALPASQPVKIIQEIFRHPVKRPIADNF